MQPQQPGGQNPYDFIINPQQAPKRSPLAGGSMITRIAIVGALLVIVMVLFVVIKSLLAGSDANVTAMVGVAQRQQEIVRISKAAAVKPGISAENKSIALTTQVSLTTAQKELITYLGSQGRKLEGKELALKFSSATDDQLKAADAATTYNSVLPQVLDTQLTLYEQELQRAYQLTSGENGRKLLNKQYEDAQLLLQKIESALED